MAFAGFKKEQERSGTDSLLCFFSFVLTSISTDVIAYLRNKTA